MTNPTAHAPHEHASDRPGRIVVLGIGNLLWADEGFGVRCVEALQRDHEFAGHVELIDGGTQGLYLLHHVQSADALLIFDAIDYGQAPGSLRVVRDEEVPRFLGVRKMSLHQTGFQEVLLLAQLTDRFPAHLLLIGCQPEAIDDYGGSLRPLVRAAVNEALQLALAALTAWDAEPRARVTPLELREAITLGELDIATYEAGRPGPERACRQGDERFLRSTMAASPE